jgi:hypothetical protein
MFYYEKPLEHQEACHLPFYRDFTIYNLCCWAPLVSPVILGILEAQTGRSEFEAFLENSYETFLKVLNRKQGL